MEFPMTMTVSHYQPFMEPQYFGPSWPEDDGEVLAMTYHEGATVAEDRLELGGHAALANLREELLAAERVRGTRSMGRWAQGHVYHKGNQISDAASEERPVAPAFKQSLQRGNVQLTPDGTRMLYQTSTLCFHPDGSNHFQGGLYVASVKGGPVHQLLSQGQLGEDTLERFSFCGTPVAR
jgi:hypothetical protein